MDKELDEFTSCPVCFEDYDESGDHVPRLLPCSHTLCDKCVRELKEGNRIRCPQDRQTYKASRKFPQNNYILNQIRTEKERRYKKCGHHGREINLFCRNEACLQELCSLCLTENHKKHDVEDLLSIKEVKLVEIAKEIKKEEERFKDYNNKLNIIREEADEELSKALTEVNRKSEDFSVLLDERLAQVYNVISCMTNIKESLSKESTYAEMSSSQATIRNEAADLTKMFERPVPIFRFKPRREDKCVGHSFGTNYPQQRECRKGLG